MSVDQLSASMQNYLKVIWGLGEWNEAPVSSSAIAAQTGVRGSTVSEAMKKLQEGGFIVHAPYGQVTLTQKGQTLALEMTRRHRLIETFLVEQLQYSWDEVHDEADQLEHAVSQQFIARLDAALGFPERDPHGDPIPREDGSVSLPEAELLADLDVPAEVRIERISDAEPEMLKFFATHGMFPGTKLAVSAGDPYTETVRVTVDQAERPILIGALASAAVWVSRTTNR